MTARLGESLGRQLKRGRAYLAVVYLVVWFIAVAAGRVAEAGASLTFTADGSGTFPKTLQWDPSGQLLTVDLSGLPARAEIFRAELALVMPRDPAEDRPLGPTRVFPVGQPDKTLALVPPRFASLDALQAVQSAVHSGQSLVLRVETTCRGVARLEVSCLNAPPPARTMLLVSNLRLIHRAGQSLLVFTEPELESRPAFDTGRDVRVFRQRLEEKHPGITFRFWRSAQRITPQTISQARLVGECGLFTAWNDGYHQDDTDQKPPLRYRVTDGGEPVPWGTGIYAHNPDQPGPAFYAVTVARQGEEDFSQLNPGNTTPEPVQETVGPGTPVLQWMESLAEWHYRRAAPGNHINRLIYTRWESWPNASRPSVPIDYLVVTAAEPVPLEPGREPESQAWRVDPAPVGLHLHCWGGSLNGGYGWWHNAHRGAVLIAANQVPYDWWTGYHEALGTAKTWGDGAVHPFTMTRLFAFLDWAARQWQEAPELARPAWPKLDLTRVFAAGTSMGGSGAPMYAIRHGDQVAWALGWVGVHMPEQSPQFKGSYERMFGPRNPAITMPDCQTSPWDFFSDVWFLGQNPARETGFIIASNGKNDGAIGWPQAVQFARALQQTRRPHLFNWALDGHGTRTLIGANFNQDVRTDQTLPAFTRCSLDQDIGTGSARSAGVIQAETSRQQAEIAAGQRREVRVDPYDGDPAGAFNAFLRWDTADIVDQPALWEMTVRLEPEAPRDSCTVDLTPRRLQQFRTPPGASFRYVVIDLQSNRQIAEGKALADHLGLLTLEQIPLVKGRNRVRIEGLRLQKVPQGRSTRAHSFNGGEPGPHAIPSPAGAAEESATASPAARISR